MSRRHTSYPIRIGQMFGTAAVVAAPWVIVFGIIPWLFGRR